MHNIVHAPLFVAPCDALSSCLSAANHAHLNTQLASNDYLHCCCLHHHLLLIEGCCRPWRVRSCHPCWACWEQCTIQQSSRLLQAAWHLHTHPMHQSRSYHPHHFQCCWGSGPPGGPPAAPWVVLNVICPGKWHLQTEASGQHAFLMIVCLH